MENFRANIALIPKPTTSEKVIGILLVVIMFVPFAIGVSTGNMALLASLPIGVFLLFVFNLFKKGKFTPKNWVQKDSFVEFRLQGVGILSGGNRMDFLWNDIEVVQLLVDAYDGETKQDGEDTKRLNGSENKIVFHANQVKYEFNFYLENAERKDALKKFLWHNSFESKHVPITIDEHVGALGVAPIELVEEESQEKKPVSKWAIGCGVLFFTPFVAVGLGTLGLVCYQFFQVMQANNWQSVRAEVLSIEMVSSEDSESTSYKIQMEYKYGVHGESYVGERVSFNVGMNNVEHYYELFDKLNRAKVITVFVNPDKPGESVVYKGVTNAMIGILIFSLMWNSLIAAFILPMLFKRVQMKQVLIVVFVVWGVGIVKFVAHVGDIYIADGVTVLEQRDVTE
ncbi:DUF3592 domain-containing protein [Pseudochryseolinea flava]|nr:DUF3592 domain-containing protein [Pseudochryseolinea flava]